jgi:uncharacterized protein (DUF1330 family)
MLQKLMHTFLIVFMTVYFTSFIEITASAEEPKGYMVGLVTVANKDWVAEYRAKNTEILKKYGGRILARGKPSVTLEGTAPDVNTMIVVEFPSMEQAKARYEDPDYQKLVRLRQTGSQADFVLIEGMKQ